MSADTVVKCDVCGRESKVGFGDSLRRGWPQCCGYTMRLFKYPDPKTIGKITKQSLGRRA